MPKLEWTEAAVEDLEQLDSQIAKRILHKLSWFSHQFANITPEPLSGDFAGMFKLRIGDWRVIYAIEAKSLVILAVGHRRNIYTK